METAWSLLPDRLHICEYCGVFVCRPVMLRGWAPCMFPPIPDHCYASMRTIHKQNKSIMNEAFHSSPFLGCTVLLVCGDILECELLQATAVSLFITKRWILLYLLTDLVNSHSYCHTILIFFLFFTVVVFLIIPAGSFTPSIPTQLLPLFLFWAVQKSQQPKLCLGGSAVLVYGWVCWAGGGLDWES